MLDARLSEAARMVSSLISDDRIALTSADGTPMSVPLPDRPDYDRQLSCQIWSVDGTLVGRSDGAPKGQLARATTTGFSNSVVDGEEWRVYTTVNTARGLRIMVGDSVAVRDRLIRNVIEGFILPAAVVLPLLALLIWVSLSRGLAPLAQLAQSLRSRPPHDLSPLPDRPVPREIRPMRRALDRLFARVAAARDAERDFTAYAAHELKTPLAGLRMQAQILRMAPDQTTRDAALRAIETSVDRTDRMVRQLLELAEVERSELAFAPCDLAALTADTAQGLETLALARNVTLVLPEQAAPVQGNAFLLGAALRNVMENAILASPRGGTVTIGVISTPGETVVAVTDQGPGIPDTLRADVTRRFLRGPGAPGQAGHQGSGLGLSIVASALDRLGGRLDIPACDAGQTVRLCLRPGIG